MVYYTKKHLLTIGLLLAISFCFAQSSVTEVLEKTITKYDASNAMSCNLEYKLYPTYKTQKHTANYSGIMLKDKQDYYLKIKQTIFLTNASSETFLKINTSQKAIQVSNTSNELASNDYLSNLKLMLKQFKTSALEDYNNFWKCVLTAPSISQLPYSKVELYVNKKDLLVTKQVLYYSTQFPHVTENGDEVMANPRLEISITDYKGELNPSEKQKLRIAEYVKKKGSELIPVKAYDNYKIL